jgi:hypothetical protein
VSREMCPRDMAEADWPRVHRFRRVFLPLCVASSLTDVAARTALGGGPHPGTCGCAVRRSHDFPAVRPCAESSALYLRAACAVQRPKISSRFARAMSYRCCQCLTENHRQLTYQTCVSGTRDFWRRRFRGRSFRASCVTHPVRPRITTVRKCQVAAICHDAAIYCALQFKE